MTREEREFKDLQSACRIANAYTQSERISNPLEREDISSAINKDLDTVIRLAND